MKYMGSKSRISKYIVPIIQKEIDKTGFDYLEPFCGGCNVIDKIIANKKYANDNNKYLIAMLKYLQENPNHFFPNEINREHYNDVKNNMQDYDDWYVGWVGFISSYNGRFFDGGYAKTIVSKTGVVRNYYDEAKRNILNQIKNLKDVNFICKDYKELNPKNLVIYCDPPYQNTTKYSTSKNFSHEEFWETMRKWSKENVVLISEENAPCDFEIIWQQDILRTQDNRSRKQTIEKLFKINT